VFEIVSADAAREIEAARGAVAPSHLGLAVLYAGQGLQREAAAEVRELVRLNPDSAVARALQRDMEGKDTGQRAGARP
jgi:hypothetical protein